MRYFFMVACAAQLCACSGVQIDQTQNSMGQPQTTLTCKNSGDCDVAAAKICGPKKVEANYSKYVIAKAKNPDADMIVDIQCK